MPVGAAAYALQLLTMLPQLIGAGQSVMTLINQGQAALANMIAEKRGPSVEEWAALNAVRDALHQQVQS